MASPADPPLHRLLSALEPRPTAVAPLARMDPADVAAALADLRALLGLPARPRFAFGARVDGPTTTTTPAAE